MKKIILLISIGLIFFSAQGVEAKLLPRYSGGSSGAAKKASSSSYSGLIISPKIRADRKALVVNFSELQKVKNITYLLMYQTNGEDQGISGTLDSSSGSSASRDLLFGTCSDVCRYHGNIINMKLEVTSVLHNGRQTMKRYRIKI